MDHLLLFLCMSSQVVFSVGQTNEIPCPLVWREVVSGEQMPSRSIATDGTDIFIARAFPENSNLVGGFFYSDAVFINDLAGKAENASSFEILTNPHNCVTEWVTSPSVVPSHSVPVDTGVPRYIGRSWESDHFLSGTVSSSRLYLTTLNGRSPITATKYEILRSFSKGLRLEIDSFVFGENPFEPSTDFMGLDEIYNGGDTYVKQIVSHTRRVKTTSNVANSKHWGVTGKVGLKIGGDIKSGNTTFAKPSVEFSKEVGYKSENGDELYDEKETEITVTKEVIVAPFTSIQICSTIKIAEDFSTDYVARGIYTSPGLNSQQVLDILRRDGKTGIPDNKGGVVTTEEGTFGGNMALTTQFIVVPIDSPGGCKDLQRKILTLKKDKAANRLNRQEITNRQQEIDSIINGEYRF